MPSVNDISEFLHRLQATISGLMQWLRTYRVGYLVGLLIAARIAWRAYRFLSLRRAKANRARGPTQPGQAAFGAMQEIVRMLEADPDTDWSKVTLTALREHLLDMDEVTLRAVVKEERVDGGLRVEISGTDRTLAAIHRIVPAHVQELNRGLGFIGLLASGAHHAVHHLAMAQAG